MLVNKNDKSFISRSDKPDVNWLNDDNYIVIPDSSPLINKVIELFPRFDIVLDEEGNLIDVVSTPKTGEERIEEIKAELTQLDKTINRATEDLYILTDLRAYDTVEQVILRKEELREELQSLREV